MVKNLFLIHTPFQLMNCLNIIENYYKNDLNDVVFMHKNLKQYTSLVEQYSDKVKAYNYEFLFDEYAETNKTLIRINLVISLLKGKRAIKKVDNKDTMYDSLFIPSENIGCNITYNYFYGLNRSLALHVYDDGVGTYAEGYLKGKQHSIYEKISRILFGTFFWRKINKIFCYQPELIDDSDLMIDKIKINSEKKIENLFSEKLSDTLIKKYNKSKIIYLDQGNLPLSYENANIFFGICKKKHKRIEVLFKNHPRVKPVYNWDSIEVDDSGKPLEAIFFNVDIGNKVIVSMCSTGCLTPYILKGEYPYVIFLGLLNTKKYEHILSTPYFQNVITAYKPNKIFIPRNNDELENIIDYLSEKIDYK